MTPWKVDPPAPASTVTVTSYAEAAERAQELYEEIREKQRDYDARYGNSQYPERYLGYAERTDALDTVSDTARAANQLGEAMDGLTDAQRAGQALAALGDGSRAAEAGIDLSRAALRERQKAELLEAIASQMDDGIMDSELEELSIRFHNHLGQSFRNTSKVQPLEGFEDVACHSDKYTFCFGDPDVGQTQTDVAVKDLAAYIRASGKYTEGTPVRLLSCESGALPNGPAQQLADELGVNVLAPTQTLYVDARGNMFITNNEDLAAMGISTGEWKMFYPGGNSR